MKKKVTPILDPAKAAEIREKARLRKANSRAKRNLGLAGKPVVKKANGKVQNYAPINAQLMMNKREGLVTKEHYKRSDFEDFFLVEDPQQNKWRIIRRQMNARFQEEIFSKYDEAEDAFTDIKTGRAIDKRWAGYQRHYQIAKDILAKIKTGKAEDIEEIASMPYPKTYAFLLAFEEVHSFVFSKRSGVAGYRTKLINLRRAFYQTLKEEPLPDVHSPHAVVSYANSWLRAVNAWAARDDRTKTDVYFKEAMFLAIAIAESAALIPGIQILASGVRTTLRNELSSSLRNKSVKIVQKDGSEKAVKLKKSKPREAIPVEDLRMILDIAFEESPRELYPFFILSLSVGGRPGEIKRLCEHRTGYLYSDGSLAYKDEVEGLPDLISKEDREGIEVNPGTSIVTRVILKRRDLFDPKPDKQFFSLSNSDSYRNLHKELRTWSERHIRTTCATHLAFCDSAIEYRADMRYVQYRLGHVDLTQTVKTYAKNAPTQTISVENYFELSKLEITHGKETIDVSEGSNLWDMFLLYDFWRRYKSYFLEQGRKDLLDKLFEAIKVELNLQLKYRTTKDSLKKLAVRA